MPAEVIGRVFNDLSRTGTDIPANPGIPGVYVVLYRVNGTCQTTTTNANGDYKFLVNTPGDYIVYETAIAPNACPPTVFGQPPGFNDSTTRRFVDWGPITQGDIDNDNIFYTAFGHVLNTTWDCAQSSIQISGNPSQLSTIDLGTGQQVNRGTLNKAALYNAIGYSKVDSMIYGWNQTDSKVISISKYTDVNQLSTIPGIPSKQQFNVGDVDSNGHLYLYNLNESLFYVVDVNPNSGTFLELVDPANGFKLSGKGVTISQPQSIFDWAFNPSDNQLYGIDSSGKVIKVNPITGQVTVLSTTGVPSGSYGAVWFDVSGNFYGIKNDTGMIYKIAVGSTSASGEAFSQATASDNNDGAGCPQLVVARPTIKKYTSRTAAIPGDTITYTLIVSNPTSSTLTNVVVTDPIPQGTTFVNNSVTLNGSSFPGNPASGINIGSLAAGASATLTFQVKVGSTIPNPNPIPNTASFTFDGNNSPIKSNEVDTIIFDNSRGVQFV